MAAGHDRFTLDGFLRGCAFRGSCTQLTAAGRYGTRPHCARGRPGAGRVRRHVGHIRRFGAGRRGVHGRVAEHAAAVHRKYPNVPVQVVSRARSLDQLQQVVTQLYADRGPSSGEGHFVSAAVDVPGNVVEYGVANLTPEISQQVARKYGDAVRVVEKHVGFASTNPGGSYIQDAQWACTAAFNFYENPTSAPFYNSQMSFLTAGHCFDGSSAVQTPSNHDGNVTSREFNSCSGPCAADVEEVFVGSGLADVNPPTPTNRLTNNQAITANDLGPYVVGEQECKLGETSGYSCGTVTQTGATICYSDPNAVSDACFSGMLIVSQDYCHGDSGGPVFSGATAKGLVSGRQWTGSTEPACGHAVGIMSTMYGVSRYYDLSRMDVG